MKYKFTVGTDSSELEAKLAITKLRRTIRHGRIAEKALKSIQTKGSYEGSVLLLNKSETEWAGSKAFEGNTQRLSQRLSISRADLGDFNKLRFTFGRIKDGSHGGHPHKMMDLLVIGDIPMQMKDFEPVYEMERDCSQKFGHVRINKGSIAWLDDSYAPVACRLFTTYASDKSKDTLNHFANELSKKLCMGLERQTELCAKSNELLETASEWLIADGIAEKLLIQILAEAKVAEIQNA